MPNAYRLYDVINQQGGTEPFMPMRLADQSIYPEDPAARGFSAQQILMGESFDEAIAAAETEDLAEAIRAMKIQAESDGYHQFLLKRGFDPCAGSSLEASAEGVPVLDASDLEASMLATGIDAGVVATPPFEECFVELPARLLPFEWRAAGCAVVAFLPDTEGIDAAIPVGFPSPERIALTLALDLVVQPKMGPVQGSIAQGFVFLDAQGRLLGDSPFIKVLVEPVSYPVSGREFVPDANGEWSAIVLPLFAATIAAFRFCNKASVSLVAKEPNSSLNRKVERRGSPALVSWFAPEETLRSVG